MEVNKELEVFTANTYDEKHIDLSSQEQLKRFFRCMQEEEDVVIEWTDETVSERKSAMLKTEGLEARFKEGQFKITSAEKLK